MRLDDPLGTAPSNPNLGGQFSQTSNPGLGVLANPGAVNRGSSAYYANMDKPTPLAPGYTQGMVNRDIATQKTREASVDRVQSPSWSQALGDSFKAYGDPQAWHSAADQISGLGSQFNGWVDRTPLLQGGGVVGTVGRGLLKGAGDIVSGTASTVDNLGGGVAQGAIHPTQIPHLLNAAVDNTVKGAGTLLKADANDIANGNLEGLVQHGLDTYAMFEGAKGVVKGGVKVMDKVTDPNTGAATIKAVKGHVASLTQDMKTVPDRGAANADLGVLRRWNENQTRPGLQRQLETPLQRGDTPSSPSSRGSNTSYDDYVNNLRWKNANLPKPLDGSTHPDWQQEQPRNKWEVDNGVASVQPKTSPVIPKINPFDNPGGADPKTPWGPSLPARQVQPKTVTESAPKTVTESAPKATTKPRVGTVPNGVAAPHAATGPSHGVLGATLVAPGARTQPQPQTQPWQEILPEDPTTDDTSTSRRRKNRTLGSGTPSSNGLTEGQFQVI